MNFGVDRILKRYEGKSYELRGRVRAIWYFFIIVLPILVAFIIIMNLLIQQGIFQPLNIIVFGIILLLGAGMVLVASGWYNTAVTILAFGVLTALILNVKGTEASGSGQRFLVSEFAYMMPVLFSMLFCKRWVLVAIVVLAETAMIATVIPSEIVDPAVRGVVLMSMSITLIISFVITLMMGNINETARRLRMEDAERIQREQRDINEVLMGSMRSVSARLDDSSRDLSGDALHFAENIQGQASSIEEITATMEEISSGAEQVSTSAQRQSEMMEDLMKGMNELVGLARDMESRITVAMARTDAIAANARAGEESIGRMDTTISAIGSTSKEMTGILGIINDISDRINLLSLNAAIEAARAGDYGRGFAVVADEISKLADQTSTSVKEIAVLIAKSESEIVKGMSGVEDTVKLMREILSGVEESNRMIAAVNKAMETAIDSTGRAHGAVNTVKQRSEEITTASVEQKTAAMEVMKTITDINQLSQTNASRAEDITGHSRDIASMAKDLREKITSLREKEAAGMSGNGA
ncbi:MAG TPA: methyl-accepting chemotaxis protein [Spirochaetota bacterium]|nr:methyl-accepting chemotaxis protein [Spirochaetota bacterium]